MYTLDELIDNLENDGIEILQKVEIPSMNVIYISIDIGIKNSTITLVYRILIQEVIKMEVQSTHDEPQYYLECEIGPEITKDIIISTYRTKLINKLSELSRSMEYIENAIGETIGLRKLN